MWINDLFELRGVACLAAEVGDTRTGHRCGDTVARKEPGLELIQFPVASEQREQVGGKHHEAIALAFALAHLHDHTLGVDSSALELTEFGDP
jgi:hypothetical protein